MAMTMTQFLTLADADLDKIMHEEEQAVETQYSKVLNVGTMDSLYDREAKMAGFGPFNEISEGGAVVYDEAIPPVTRRYDFITKGSGYKITDKLWKNDRYGEVRRFERDLVRADEDDTEQFAFGLLNNAANTTVSSGFDGLALASTAHTRMDGGAVQSNSLSTALSLAALQDAVIAFKSLLDDRGRPYKSLPRKLIIPIDLEMVAEEILGSAMRPDTANNATNALRMYGLTPVPLYYITSATFAALVGDKHDLHLKWRTRPVTSRGEDFDTDTIKVKRKKEFARGHGEWRGFMLLNA